ncbi:MAG: TonB family protein [Pyrinomonadaceae bacterium]
MNRAISILLLTVCTYVGAAISQPSAHPGIVLYQQGKNAEAVRSLEIAVKTKEFEKSAEVWNYLGLCYTKNPDFNRARKAFEKAVKLMPSNSVYRANLGYVHLMTRQYSKARSEAKKAIELDPKNLTAYYLRGSASFLDNELYDAEKDADQIMTIDPTYAKGYVLKSNVLVSRLGQKLVGGSTPRDEIKYLESAANVLSKGIESCNCKGDAEHKLLVDELESVDVFYKYFSKEKPDPRIKAEPDPTVTPLKVTYKPKPSYTDSARSKGVRGTIQVAVLFGANGKVQRVLLLKRLGSGLDENVMRMAYRIGFEPQMKDGTPVSVVRIVEYGFDIH